MPKLDRKSRVPAPEVRLQPAAEPARSVKGWTLLEPVAEGPHACTYRAQPEGSPSYRPAQYVAKLLRPDLEEDPRAVAILRREALVGSTVAHPNLIPILWSSLGEPPAMALMPWLAGATLARRLAAGLRPDLPQSLWIARQVAQALDALEAAGWTHGDVKPANVMVSPSGHATLLDLGFARRRDETGSVVGRPFLGTCRYVAPEAITSTYGADLRSDIYSLGAVLFEMISSRAPFEGRDLAELASHHKQSRPPDLRKFAPDLPAGVTRLVREMLAKEPLRRPQTPGELIGRLAELEIATFNRRLAVS